eukprot:4153708-Alexandrium_andersonii.AAC.1
MIRRPPRSTLHIVGSVKMCIRDSFSMLQPRGPVNDLVCPVIDLARAPLPIPVSYTHLRAHETSAHL